MTELQSQPSTIFKFKTLGLPRENYESVNVSSKVSVNQI